MAEVRLEGLHKRLGTAEVLAGISLTIRDGELFTIVGPSGCGKSTLLHLIAGLEKPTKGRICFDERDVTALEPRERNVAMVFQSYALYPHMTVAENLAFPLRVAGRGGRSDRAAVEGEVQRVTSLLGLEGLLGRRPRELSGGQRQRVALGRALIRKPRVFLLDEPLSNLDPQLRTGMRAELRRLHDELGITTIYVTHDQTEAMTLADRLAVLDRGQLQQVGTPQDLYDSPANAFVAGFIGQPSMNLLEARIERGRVVAGSLQIPLPCGTGERRAGDGVRLGIRPEEVRVSGLAAREDQPARNDRSATGIVRLVEPIAGQIWVTVELEVSEPFTTIVGLADKGFNLRPRERVTVSVVGARLHLFEPDTGVRLGSGV